MNVDVTVYYQGYHGDLNETFVVGSVDEASRKLVKATYEVMNEFAAALSHYKAHVHIPSYFPMWRSACLRPLQQ